jgi:hypothetical protein
MAHVKQRRRDSARTCEWVRVDVMVRDGGDIKAVSESKCEVLMLCFCFLKDRTKRIIEQRELVSVKCIEYMQVLSFMRAFIHQYVCGQT